MKPFGHVSYANPDDEDQMSDYELKINGKLHAAVVLMVTKSDENGRPRECRIVYPDEIVKVSDGLEFVTCFVPANVIEKVS